MPNDQVKTTVLIPAWDAYAGDPLRVALDSLVDQSCIFAFLLVDNASATPLPTVDGAKIVRSGSRLSLGSARNLGLQHVKTPYVIFWDADDQMLPGTLRRLEAEIEADPRLVAFGMAIEELPSRQRHRWPRRYLPVLARFPVLLSLAEPVWAQFPTTGATIIRTDAAVAAGGFADADSGEDWCLGVSLAFRGRIGWSEQPGRVYRLDPQSMWARHMSFSHQLQHARAVRARLRTDRGVPAWARSMVGVIQMAQYLAIVAHTAVAAIRRFRRGSG